MFNFKKLVKSVVIFCILMVTVTQNIYAFTPRTEFSNDDANLIYWKKPYNPFLRNWSLAGGNCTWYAYGRAWELMGEKPNLSVNGAHRWFSYNDGYERGTEPRVGAVACWSDKSNSVGHVAIVEAVDGDMVTLSESGWSYTNKFFTTKTKHKNDLDYTVSGVTRRFQGYIYLPIKLDPMINLESDIDSIPTTPMVNIEQLKQMRENISQYEQEPGIKIYINGQYMEFSPECAEIENVISVPARDLIESLGGTVRWIEEEHKIDAFINDSILTTRLNSNVLFLNSMAIKTDSIVQINENGKTMFPLKAVITVLGGRIISIDDAKNVHISI